MFKKGSRACLKNHSRNLHARSDQRHFISFESGNGSHTVYIIQETLVYPVACENNMHRFVLLLQKLGNHIHSCDMLIQKSKGSRPIPENRIPGLQLPCGQNLVHSEYCVSLLPALPHLTGRSRSPSSRSGRS